MNLCLTLNRSYADLRRLGREVIEDLRRQVMHGLTVYADWEGVCYRIPPIVLRSTIEILDQYNNPPSGWHNIVPPDVGRIYITQMVLCEKPENLRYYSPCSAASHSDAHQDPDGPVEPLFD